MTRRLRWLRDQLSRVLLTRCSASMWTARAAVLLLPLAALVASLPAGASVWPTYWVVVGVAAIGATVAPATPVLVLVLAAVMLWWGTEVPHPLSAWVLVAAAAMMAAHVAGLLTDLGPPILVLDRRLLRLWTLRGLLTTAAALPAWAMARLVSGVAEQPGVWVAGATASLVSLLAVWFVVRPHAEA